MFRFLDLPAGTHSIPRCTYDNTNWSGELRNRIYDFAAITTDCDQHSCVLPTLSLAHTCRQVRTEYLPICKNAPAVVLWSDLEEYFSVFFQNVNSWVADFTQAPRSMTILVDFGPPHQEGTIDLLPLIKIQHANTTFSCHFERRADDPKDDSVRAVNHRVYFKSDTEMLVALLEHE
jgi:hypothetical protein